MHEVATQAVDSSVEDAQALLTALDEIEADLQRFSFRVEDNTCPEGHSFHHHTAEALHGPLSFCHEQRTGCAHLPEVSADGTILDTSLQRLHALQFISGEQFDRLRKTLKSIAEELGRLDRWRSARINDWRDSLEKNIFVTHDDIARFIPELTAALDEQFNPLQMKLILRRLWVIQEMLAVIVCRRIDLQKESGELPETELAHPVVTYETRSDAMARLGIKASNA